MNNLTISQKGIKHIKCFEGCRLEAYADAVGTWTIGYGHTKSVRRGMTITKETALELLKEDLREFENAVNKLVKVPLNQNQFDALVSFTYNVGIYALAGSTLLKFLNDGNYNAAAEQFLRWNKAGGKELTGLTKRRIAEKEMFIRNC